MNILFFKETLNIIDEILVLLLLQFGNTTEQLLTIRNNGCKIITMNRNMYNDAIPRPNSIHTYTWKIRRARYTNTSSVAEKFV